MNWAWKRNTFSRSNYNWVGWVFGDQEEDAMAWSGQCCQCIHMQIMQNMHISLFCIFYGKRLHLLFCILWILFCIFYCVFCELYRIFCKRKRYMCIFCILFCIYFFACVALHILHILHIIQHIILHISKYFAFSYLNYLFEYKNAMYVYFICI